MTRFKIPELPLVHLETYLAYHKAPTPQHTNVMEITVDSMGSSCIRSLTGTEVRLREQVLDRCITVANQQKANPEKKFFIEHMTICGEWTLLKVYNINPDGTHVYNDTITRLLQNTNNMYLVQSILSQAIMA